MVYAQQSNSPISTDLPSLVSPSPTVAALMKYEEIPINNYTGIPDIKVPLYSYKFPSNEISLNIGLSYHSASTKLDEVASDIGLGWSLTCGGSISRTVMGVADEFYEAANFGIYRSNLLNGNNYYQTLQALQTNILSNDVYEKKVIGPYHSELVKEFFWEKDVKGKYDSQHDLWQYNFHGHTGRFYIEKQSNGLLEVKLLENTKLKIINHYNIPSQNVSFFEHFKPTGFTIFDELGYKYIFDVEEVTNSVQLTQTTHQNDVINSSVNSKSFISAFHLSKIYDNNNNLLIDYLYTDSGREHISNPSATYYYSSTNEDLGYELNNIIADHAEDYGQSFLQGLYKPKSILSNSGNSYDAKKISEIKITGVGNVYFDYQIGRQDDNYTNKDSVRVLKGIKIKDLNNTTIKDFALEHEYKYAVVKKLFLKNIKQISGNNQLGIYDFYYKEPLGIILNPTKDSWGYLKNNDEFTTGLNREVDKDLVSMFALEKMVLPTKGCVIIDYESNTYSYIKDSQLTNFDENPYNWDPQTTSKTFNTLTNNTTSFFNLNEAQDVLFSKEIKIQSNDWGFYIYKDFVSNSNFVGAITSDSTPNSYGNYKLDNLQSGNYVVRFSINELLPPSNQPYLSKITAVYKNKKTNSAYKNYNYGGGFRVASIATYNQNVNVGDFRAIPLTKKIFNYSDLKMLSQSSGVLVTPTVFNYQTSYLRPALLVTAAKTINYDVYTDYNKKGNSKTKGADIGYKNVTVYNQNKGENNGRSEYSYTTSLEFPNYDFPIEEVFLPSISYDYKRGLLTKEEFFDKSDKITLSKQHNYIFEDYKLTTGLHTFGTYDQGYNSSPVLKLFSQYAIFKNAKDGNCKPGTAVGKTCEIGSYLATFRDDLNIGIAQSFETYGWAKLASTNTQEYFYNGSNTNIVNTNESFTYNPDNLKINSTSSINSLGENITTNYYYHTGNSIHSQNRISEIDRVETFKNGQLLNTSKVNYSKIWIGNVSFLPQTIQTSKGTNALESRITYNKYDENGNPLEVQQESGIKISYIWGYNNTQPVAKLENIAYTSIPANLITAIQTASNGTDESALLTALDALRLSSNANLQNAMITTYTYKPLIGIRTVTDPKGDKITYHYDSFNRLEFVKDKNQNILSENEYHYRTQN